MPSCFFHLNTNSECPSREDPSFLSTFPAASLRCFILLRSFSPSSPSIRPFITLATSSRSTIPCSLAFGHIATRRSSTNINAFIFCSAWSGQAISGVPWATLSSVEFQPQWLRNPPVEPCPRTWICGAQVDTTSLAPLSPLEPFR